MIFGHREATEFLSLLTGFLTSNPPGKREKEGENFITYYDKLNDYFKVSVFLLNTLYETLQADY